MRGDKSNHDKHIVEEQCAETLDEEEEYISGKGNMNEETQEEESDDDSWSRNSNQSAAKTK